MEDLLPRCSFFLERKRSSIPREILLPFRFGDPDERDLLLSFGDVGFGDESSEPLFMKPKLWDSSPVRFERSFIVVVNSQ